MADDEITGRVVRTGPEERAAVDARRAFLGQLSRRELADRHHAAQLANGTPEIPCDHWPKDMLIRAVLEDEGHLWHPTKRTARLRAVPVFVFMVAAIVTVGATGWETKTQLQITAIASIWAATFYAILAYTR